MQVLKKQVIYFDSFVPIFFCPSLNGLPASLKAAIAKGKVTAVSLRLPPAESVHRMFAMPVEPQKKIESMTAC